jgi:hypothetical protein
MRTRWIVAGILVVVGLVWIGQGTGFIRGSSFMTDDLRWAVIGTVSLAAGIVIAAAILRRRPSA